MRSHCWKTCCWQEVATAAHSTAARMAAAAALGEQPVERRTRGERQVGVRQQHLLKGQATSNSNGLRLESCWTYPTPFIQAVRLVLVLVQVEAVMVAQAAIVALVLVVVVVTARLVRAHLLQIQQRMQ